MQSRQPLPPERLADGLEVGDLHPGAARLPQRDRFVDRVHQRGAFAPDVTGIDRFVLRHHFGQLGEFRRLRETARRIHQTGGHAPGPLRQRFVELPLHLGHLRVRRRPVVPADRGDPHRPLRRQHRQIDSRIGLGNRGGEPVEIRPVDSARRQRSAQGAQIGFQIGEPAFAGRKRPNAAVGRHLGRDALHDLAVAQRIVENFPVRVGMQVDKPRCHHQPRHIQLLAGDPRLDPANLADPVVFDPHIAPVAGRTGSIHDGPAAQNNAAHFCTSFFCSLAAHRLLREVVLPDCRFATTPE